MSSFLSMYTDRVENKKDSNMNLQNLRKLRTRKPDNAPITSQIEALTTSRIEWLTAFCENWTQKIHKQ